MFRKEDVLFFVIQFYSSGRVWRSVLQFRDWTWRRGNKSLISLLSIVMGFRDDIGLVIISCNGVIVCCTCTRQLRKRSSEKRSIWTKKQTKMKKLFIKLKFLQIGTICFSLLSMIRKYFWDGFHGVKKVLILNVFWSHPNWVFFTWISLYFLINLKNGVFFTGLFGNSSARSSLRRLVYLMLVCYRYDLLCLEGLAQSLRVFNEQDKTPTYSLAKIGRESMLKMQVKPEVVIANCHDFQSDNYICMHDLCVLLL